MQGKIINCGDVGLKGETTNLNTYEDFQSVHINENMLEVVMNHINAFIAEACENYTAPAAAIAIHTCKKKIKALHGAFILVAS